jgi:hypothetical protein
VVVAACSAAVVARDVVYMSKVVRLFNTQGHYERGHYVTIPSRTYHNPQPSLHTPILFASHELRNTLFHWNLGLHLRRHGLVLRLLVQCYLGIAVIVESGSQSFQNNWLIVKLIVVWSGVAVRLRLLSLTLLLYRLRWTVFD